MPAARAVQCRSHDASSIQSEYRKPDFTGRKIQVQIVASAAYPRPPGIIDGAAPVRNSNRRGNYSEDVSSRGQIPRGIG